MLEWIYHYVLFLLETVTIVVAIAFVIGLVARQKSQAQSAQPRLEVRDRSEHFKEQRQRLEMARLGPAQGAKALKQWAKEEKREAKKAKKAGKKESSETSAVAWVIAFNGDIKASATADMVEQINTILLSARQGDEVVLRLESGGGMVHAYGLAAAQLDRIRQAGLKLTICVDKVAASGGYMMACCADHLVAAPFAVVGSIGVVAQVPNVHRLLKKNDVDVEVLTAGKHKRTLTIMGENTEEGRAKFLEELADTHELFKHYVSQRRPQLAIDDIATGETWYGSEALENGLVDEVATSDAYLQQCAAQGKVFELSLKQPRSLVQRLGKQASDMAERGVDRGVERLTQLKWERQ